MNRSILSALNKIGVPTETVRRIVEHLAFDYCPPFVIRAEKRARFILEKECRINQYLRDGGQYLDIGCGNGHFMKVLYEDNQHKNADFMGIDLNNYPARSINQWMIKNRKNKLEPFFTKANATKLPFPDKKFDGLFIIFVLHHLKKEDQEDALKEASRVTKDGGYVFVLEEIVDSESQRRITEEADIRVNWEKETDIHNYKSREEWRRLFKRLNFSILKIYSFMANYHGLKLKHANFVLKV